MDIQSQIRDVLSETVGKTSQKNGGITEEDMMGLLREKGENLKQCKHTLFLSP